MVSATLSVCLSHPLSSGSQVAGDYGTVTDSPTVRATPRGTASTTSANVSTSEDTPFTKQIIVNH